MYQGVLDKHLLKSLVVVVHLFGFEVVLAGLSLGRRLVELERAKERLMLAPCPVVVIERIEVVAVSFAAVAVERVVKC